MADDDQPKTAPAGQLPVTWSQGSMGGTGQKIKSSALVMADASQIATFSDQRAKTCGSCRHFRGPEKDRTAVNGFIARAVLEAKWKLGFLAPDPSVLGRCSEDNELCTGPTSKACDHYSESRGRIR